MNDKILGPDSGENVTAVLADALRKADVHMTILKIAAFIDNYLPDIRNSEHPARREDMGQLVVELLHDETTEFVRHSAIEIETNHMSTAPLLEGGLKRPHKIFRLLVNFHFAVSDDAEHATAADIETRKQPGEV